MLKIGIASLNKIRNNPFVIQSLKTMFLRIIGIVTLFGFTLFLTHNYAPKIIGQYDFIRTFLLVVGSIAILGTDQSVLYFTGIFKSQGHDHNLKSIYKKICCLIFLASTVIFVLLLVVGRLITEFFFQDTTTYPLIFKATAILFFYSMTLFNTEVFRALDSVYIAELFRNTFKYFSVIFGSIVLLSVKKESYLVDTFLIGFVLLAIISTIMIVRIFKNSNVIMDTKNDYSYGYILKKSYPMATSTLAIFLLMSFDVIFIKKYKGDASVAFYAIAVKLMTILLMIMNSVTITVSTKISEYFTSGNMAALRKTMRNSSRLIFGLSFPIVLFVCFFAESILGFFGKNYLEAKSALLVLVVGQGICSLFGAVQVYLNMTGRQNIFQTILILAVILNFLLNRYLVPRYGMVGGAIAYSVSMFFWNFIAAVIIYSKDKISVFLT